MNVLLWVFQVLGALLYLSGGAYKAFNFDELATQMDVLSPGGWRAVGVFEIAGGLLLVVPAAMQWMPVLTPVAAAALTLETLALAALYAKYSLAVTTSNPLVWAVGMALLVGLVAYGRYALSPIV